MLYEHDGKRDLYQRLCITEISQSNWTKGNKKLMTKINATSWVSTGFKQYYMHVKIALPLKLIEFSLFSCSTCI